MQFRLSVPEEMLTLRNPGYETSVVNNNVFTGSFLASSEYNGGCVQQPDSYVASTYPSLSGISSEWTVRHSLIIQ